MDEKNLQHQDVLMQPVMWEGQEYFTSQYFHRQYRESSGMAGKYEQHRNFTRLIRQIEAYDIYIEQGDIVELTWNHYKSLKNNGNSLLDSLKTLEAMFLATSYNPLMLINKTGQIALTHHLDDELSKQMSVAANTMVARQDTPTMSVQMLIAHAQQLLDMANLMADHDERIKRLEALQGSDTGYVTILGYCRLRGLKRSMTESQAMGKEATKQAKEIGLRLGDVPDERWGKVKSYPIDFLDEIFFPESKRLGMHLDSGQVDFPDPKDW